MTSRLGKLQFSLVAVVLLILSIAVANRDTSIGTDTIRYIHQFQISSTRYDLARYEVGFSSIAVLVGKFSSDYRAFFSFVYLLMNAGLLLSLRLLLRERLDLSAVLLFLGLCFFSSWYQSASVNGIRQGVSLPFLYAAFILAQDKRYAAAGVMATISVSLHTSSALALPFFIFAKTSLRATFAFFVVSALAYWTGVTESLVEAISSTFSLSLYSELMRYNDEFAQWYGFQLSFFLYSLFWGVLYFTVCELSRLDAGSRLEDATKVYLTMMMPYLYFAHGGFTNRYAFIGWLFLPFLHSSAFMSVSRLQGLRGIVAVLVFFSGLIYYILIVSGRIS